MIWQKQPPKESKVHVVSNEASIQLLFKCSEKMHVPSYLGNERQVYLQQII